VKDTDKCVVGLFLGKNEILLAGDNSWIFLFKNIFFNINTLKKFNIFFLKSTYFYNTSISKSNAPLVICTVFVCI